MISAAVWPEPMVVPSPEAFFGKTNEVTVIGGADQCQLTVL